MPGVMLLLVTSSGQCRCVHGEQIDLACLGSPSIRRASHVEAEAVGRWSTGRWSVDLSPVGGPTLGPFNRRSEALQSEQRWLDEHLHRITADDEGEAGANADAHALTPK